jgi:hypothetical protein
MRRSNYILTEQLVSQLVTWSWGDCPAGRSHPSPNHQGPDGWRLARVSGVAHPGAAGVATPPTPSPSQRHLITLIPHRWCLALEDGFRGACGPSRPPTTYQTLGEGDSNITLHPHT